MSLLAQRPCCPDNFPADVTVRALQPATGRPRRIYGEGIATGIATFETTCPARATLDAKWLRASPGGSPNSTARSSGGPPPARSPPASATPATRKRQSMSPTGLGRGVGNALLHKQVTAADHTGQWMLRIAIFTKYRASIALHHAAGYRTIGIRERIAQRDRTWHDPVLIERHSPVNWRAREAQYPPWGNLLQHKRPGRSTGDVATEAARPHRTGSVTRGSAETGASPPNRGGEATYCSTVSAVKGTPVVIDPSPFVSATSPEQLVIEWRINRDGGEEGDSA